MNLESDRRKPPHRGGNMRPNSFGLSFHHMGLAVREPHDAFRYLEELGYQISSTVADPLQRVNLAFCSHPAMPDVELVWPGKEPSPIDAIVKQNSGLVYHLCYTADDLRDLVRRAHILVDIGEGALRIVPAFLQAEIKDDVPKAAAG